MDNYFEGCTTSEQVKIRYRELCKKWHPDLGPTEDSAVRTARMQ